MDWTSSPLSSPPSSLSSTPKSSLARYIVTIAYNPASPAGSQISHFQSVLFDLMPALGPAQFAASSANRVTKRSGLRARKANPVVNYTKLPTPSQPAKAPRLQRKRKRTQSTPSEAEQPSELDTHEPLTKKQDTDDADFKPEQAEDVPITPATRRKSNTRAKKAQSNSMPAEMYYGSKQAGKPEPWGAPEIWALKRQSLCETVEGFDAYQSGAYITGGIGYGFLVDGEVGIRDRFDDQIIITSIGGGRVSDGAGKMIVTKDQEETASALAFKRSKKFMQPVVVIAGWGNSRSPSRLPHPYNVLGHFHVTDVWCEVVLGYKRWMVRFEKINLSHRSWWLPNTTLQETEVALPDFQALQVEIIACSRCQQESKAIFNAGFTCLNTACTGFFDFGKVIDHDQLDYADAFLMARTEYIGTTPLSANPGLVTVKVMEEGRLTGYEARCKKGIVCPKCGCCSRRALWNAWSCENPSCDFIHSITLRNIPAAMAMTTSLEGSRPFYDNLILQNSMIMGSYNVFTYYLPGNDGSFIGFVRVYKSAPAINSQKDGPDNLFYDMQNGAFGLKRKAARLAGKQSELLTNHYATNFGAPYKYVVATDSRSFAQAPPVVWKALKRMTWAGKKAVVKAPEKYETEEFKDFNEMLAVGYTQHGAMGYHTDGEETLGPTVATLSLGASATMSFRPMAKTTIGGSSKNARGTKKDVLRIHLEHGDMIIMHGAGIQKLYEHRVENLGDLRFALTSRYIIPEKMDTEAERIHTLESATLPPEADAYDYDGDIDAELVVNQDASEMIVQESTSIAKAVERMVLDGALTEAQKAVLRQQAHDFIAQLDLHEKQRATATDAMKLGEPMGEAHPDTTDSNEQYGGGADPDVEDISEQQVEVAVNTKMEID